MLEGALIGGGIGAGLGAVGGYLEAKSADEAARRLRKQIRMGVSLGQADTVRQTAAYLGSSNFRAANNLVRGLYGMGEQSGEELYNQLLGLYGGSAGGFGFKEGAFGYGLKGHDEQAIRNEAYVQSVLGLAPSPVSYRGPVSPRDVAGGLGLVREGMYASNEDALRSIGQREGGEDRAAGDAALAELNQTTRAQNNPLLQNFSKSINQTLAARGLNAGMSAAAVEASGLAAYNTQLQLQQLPTLLNLAAAPFTMAEQLGGFGGNAARNVFGATGGQAVYGQVAPGAMDRGPHAGLTGALSGAVAGFSSGASLGLNVSSLLGAGNNGPLNTDELDALRGKGSPKRSPYFAAGGSGYV